MPHVASRARVFAPWRAAILGISRTLSARECARTVSIIGGLVPTRALGGDERARNARKARRVGGQTRALGRDDVTRSAGTT